MDSKPTPGLIVIMASGAVAFIFSFFDFFERSGSVWKFGPGIWLPLLGLAAGALAAVRAFAPQVELPEKIATFTVPQLLVVIGMVTAFIGVGFLFIDRSGRTFEIGFFFEFLASIGILVGALIELLAGDKATDGYGGGYGQPPPPQQPGQF